MNDEEKEVTRRNVTDTRSQPENRLEVFEVEDGPFPGHP
jgi:hypothetical protein